MSLSYDEIHDAVRSVVGRHVVLRSGLIGPGGELVPVVRVVGRLLDILSDRADDQFEAVLEAPQKELRPLFVVQRAHFTRGGAWPLDPDPAVTALDMAAPDFDHRSAIRSSLDFGLSVICGDVLVTELQVRRRR